MLRALALALGFADLVSSRGRLHCNLIALDEVRITVLYAVKDLWHTSHASQQRIRPLSGLGFCQNVHIRKAAKAICGFAL